MRQDVPLSLRNHSWQHRSKTRVTFLITKVFLITKLFCCVFVLLHELVGGELVGISKKEKMYNKSNE